MTRSLLLILLIAAVAAPAAAAEKKTFEERSDVVAVEVPVNVSGRDGAPMRGLEASDFELYDNGKPQPIRDLEIVDLEALEVAGDVRRTREALPSSARRHFLLLFDLSFSDPASVLKARQAARDWVVSALHPTDLAAVMIYSLEIGPRLVVTFTPDRGQLARAIDALGAPEQLDPRFGDPLRFVLQDPRELDPGGVGLLEGTGGGGDLRDVVLENLRILGIQIERSQKAFERSRIAAWSRSLGDVARKLDAVQGRKHVVYFSEGFDGTLLLGRQPSADDPRAQQEQADRERGLLWAVDTDNVYGNSTLQGHVERMLEEFRRADCVIQAVDISGMNADLGADQRLHQVGQDALFYLARGTGGDLYEDANSFGEQLDQVLRRTQVTYVLTFEPRDLELDGSYHRLKVKLKDKVKGAQLSHRAGYYAPRPYEELHPLEKSLLASDAIAAAAPRRDVGLAVLAPPFQVSAGAYVPVIIEIDGADLLDGRRDGTVAVELFAYASDETGAMRDYLTQSLQLDLARVGAAVEASGLKYYGHLDLAPGRYLVRVLVRNAESGRTGVETVAVEVPAREPRRPALLPPLFLEAPGSWLMVREPHDESSGGTVVYPFTVNGDPYVPAARPRLRAAEPSQLCLVAYNLGGELEITSRVLDAEGAAVRGGRLAAVERTVTGIEGVSKLLATFDPRGLRAGAYTLEIDVTDPETGAVESSSIAFEVVG